MLYQSPKREITAVAVAKDGSIYAAGVGTRIPPDASFKEMEHDYYSNLSDYTEALASQIQSRLKGQP